MSIITGANITVISCNAELCMARFDLLGNPPDPVRAREKAVLDGWITVKPPTGPAVDYCPRHAFGSKKASSPGARVFGPPRTEEV